MQITVVIPTYQRPQLLQKCLTAIQQQSLNKEEFEVIVVSDGPDEQTEAIVHDFKGNSNFKYLSLPIKKGPAAARNLGWLSAKAPIIAFTDDDCLADTYWLESILSVADSKKLEAFTGRVVVPRHKWPTDHERNTAGLETADFVTANCVCTKLALIATGGFDEQFSMAWREDSDLEFKLRLNSIPITRIDPAVVIHPVRNAKWGLSIMEQKKTLFNALLYRKYPVLYRERIQPKLPYLYYRIVVSFLTFITGAIFHLPLLRSAGLVLWGLLTSYFILKRLTGTRLSGSHVSEMIFTSVLIPFYSIYWQWYGAIKYKTLLI